MAKVNVLQDHVNLYESVESLYETYRNGNKKDFVEGVKEIGVARFFVMATNDALDCGEPSLIREELETLHKMAITIEARTY